LPRVPEIAKARISARQPRIARTKVRDEINLAVASLVRGGAERIVLDTCGALVRSGRRVHLIVLHRRESEYAIPPGVRLSRIGRPPDPALDEVAREGQLGPGFWPRIVLVGLALRLIWVYYTDTLPLGGDPSWYFSPDSYMGSDQFAKWVAGEVDLLDHLVKEFGLRK